ncbi:AAA family ATPase [Morganella morganii]|uniref:ParA family protein n=1 Tax=Morganella morganii TaxID=582 RepID=UPI002FDAB7B5|nr:AAA family ATPase [Morganella morganii]
MAAPVISFINMKGGVGKTTLCVGMAEYLANYMGKKILVIDVDPQFNATQSLMGKYGKVDDYMENHLSNGNTIRKIFETPSNVMERSKIASPEDVITKIDDNLDIILGDINIIFDTSQESVRVNKINNFINKNNLKNHYDFIFIDSPPTISLFTDAALIASNYYLVPVKIDHYSVLGATSLISAIDTLQDNHNKTLIHIGFIYTNTDDDFTQKTTKIKEQFEEKSPFDSMYFFNNRLSYVRNLMVGAQGNIPSHYERSRNDIANICDEFLSRMNQIAEDTNG